MIVAGVQFDIAWLDAAENLRRVAPMVREAAGRGARLVVLPEMFATGFTMDVARAAESAAAIRAGCALLAREAGVTLVAGVAEGPAEGGGDLEAPDVEEAAAPRAAADHRGRNMAHAWGPDGGLVASYQKVHPFSLAGEERHVAGGDAATVFAVEGVRVGLAICYDLRFPELFRGLAERVDLFVVPANWPTARRHAWRTLQQARAMDALAFVLGVNRVGEDGSGQAHPGASLLVDPLGEVVADAGDAAALVMGEVDAERVAALRARFSFLRDRRPEVYGRWGGPGASESAPR